MVMREARSANIVAMTPRIAILVLLTASLPAAAEEVQPPQSIEVRSPSKAYRFVVTAGRRESTATLFRDATSVWSAVVVHPRTAIVLDDGRAITVDTWLNAGGDHALVVYDPKGAVVLDRRLEELLTTAEILGLTPSRGGRRWLMGKPVATADRVTLPIGTGKQALEVRLEDGAQYRDGKLAAVPTDAARFTAYVTGKRAHDGVRIQYMELDATGSGRTCTAEPTVTKCSVAMPGGGQQNTSKRHTAAAFRKALATAPGLTKLPTGIRATGERWIVIFDFDEAGYRYRYAWTWTKSPEGDAAKLLRDLGVR